MPDMDSKQNQQNMDIHCQHLLSSPHLHRFSFQQNPGFDAKSTPSAVWKWKSLQPHGIYSPWNSPGQNIGVGSLSLLRRIFPTRGSNSGLPHCGWILYWLGHKGSPIILEWVAYPFSRRSSQSRNWTRPPALQVYSLPAELPEKPKQIIPNLNWSKINTGFLTLGF